MSEPSFSLEDLKILASLAESAVKHATTEEEYNLASLELKSTLKLIEELEG